MNQVQLIGRLVQENELKTLKDQKTLVLNNVIAVTSYTGNGNNRSDFIPFVAWNGHAKFISSYIQKGDELALVGSIQSGKYENEAGQTVYTLKLKVNEVRALRKSRANREAGQIQDSPQEVQADVVKE